MRKAILLIMMLVLTINLVGCADVKMVENENQLKVISMSSGIGGIKNEEGNYDRQRFSFTLTLLNGENDEVYINWIEPIFNERFLEKCEEKELKINIEKSVLSKQTININGDIIFNSKDMTKQEIIELEPFIKEIKVSTEKNLKLKWNKGD